MQRRDQQPSDAVYRQRTLLWLAMTLSIVMYFIIMRLVRPAEVREDPTFARTLLIVAVGLVATSFRLKGLLLRHVADATTLLRRQWRAEVIVLAMCDAAALYGVVVWLVTGWSQSYLFLLIGLIGVVLHRPKRVE